MGEGEEGWWEKGKLRRGGGRRRGGVVGEGEEGWWEKGKLRRGGGRSGGVVGEGEEGWWENSKGRRVGGRIRKGGAVVREGTELGRRGTGWCRGGELRRVWCCRRKGEMGAIREGSGDGRKRGQPNNYVYLQVRRRTSPLFCS